MTNNKTFTKKTLSNVHIFTVSSESTKYATYFCLAFINTTEET